jgi:hypothetical protein
MKNKKIVWMGSLLGMLLLIMNACYYDEVLPVESSVGDVGNGTFSKDIIPIFNAGCNVTGCHSAGGQKPSLTTVSAFASLSNGGYINKTAPENSLLYLWMKGSKGAPMPPAGSDATYNAKVLKWIELGALNN